MFHAYVTRSMWYYLGISSFSLGVNTIDYKLHDLYRPIQINGIHNRVYYAEHMASTALRAYVACYWESGTVDSSDANNVHPDNIVARVLPDGCTDMLITYSPKFKKHSFAYCGNYTRPVALTIQPSNDALIAGEYTFGVRFSPGGASRFHGLPLDEFTDKRLSLVELWPDNLHALEDKMMNTTSFMERARIMDTYLSHLAEKRSDPFEDTMLKNVCYRLFKESGQISIKELALLEVISERHLHRRFTQTIGITPKRFSEIVRFHHTLRGIKEDKVSDWAFFANEYGFFDQAHLIRQFHKFYGDTPLTAAKELKQLV